MPGMTITYALIQRVEKVAEAREYVYPMPCQRLCMEVSDRARIITKAEVSRLLSRAGSVVGRSLRFLIETPGVPTHRCPRLRVPEIWEKQQGVRSRHPVHWPPSCKADRNRVPNLPILNSRTGGFAAGVGPGSVLAKYRPDLVNLPTASAEHCTGDGLMLGPSAECRILGARVRFEMREH